MSPLARHKWNSAPALLCLLLILAGCAATPSPVNQIPEGDFRERIQVQQDAGVRISVGVPSASETQEIFDKPLYRQRIQPVWLKIENLRQTPITFLPVGLDPDYYTPLEVANYGTADETPADALINEFFLDQSISMLLLPGEERSGFVFTRLDEGTKAFNVDVAGEEGFESFTFFVPVPGLNIDHYSVDWDNLYPADRYVELDRNQLIAEIEDYVCCVTDKDGENNGDPLNLVLIGHPDDIYRAFLRAGWDETEAVTRASGWKTVKSFLSGGEYRYSPVSSLYVFGRPQDIAFQRIRDNIHERNHLRLWMSRVTYQGVPVWIGQISRDIGVRFTTKTITTHKIDPDVDETREYLLENLVYAQSVEKFGYVGGVGEVPMDQPRGNLTGDPWFSNGYRLVIWLSTQPVPLEEIEVLDWRNPHEHEEKRR